MQRNHDQQVEPNVGGLRLQSSMGAFQGLQSGLAGHSLASAHSGNLDRLRGPGSVAQQFAAANAGGQGNAQLQARLFTRTRSLCVVKLPLRRRKYGRPKIM